MRYTSDYEERGRQPDWDDSSPTTTGDADYQYHRPANRTHTRAKENDAKHPENAIGAGTGVSCTGTIAGIVKIPISGAHASQGGDVSSLPTIRSTTPTSSIQTYAHTTGTTQDKSCEVITREEEGRLGKGPGNGRDSLPQWMGRQTGERERVFTPQSGKRPDEDRDTSTRWLERRGPERTSIVWRSGLGDRDPETGSVRAGGGAAIGWSAF